MTSDPITRPNAALEGRCRVEVVTAFLLLGPLLSWGPTRDLPDSSSAGPGSLGTAANARMEVGFDVLETIATTAEPPSDQDVDTVWADWNPVHFDGDRGRTDYSLAKLDGLSCMRAVARGGGSALVREMEVDLARTPIIRWSWQAQEGVRGSDLGRKEGDDLTARVYVNFTFDSESASLWERIAHRIGRLRFGDELPGSAITYGWADEEPPGLTGPNAYTERVQVVVVRNAEHVGQGWFHEERNVLQDYRQLFGQDPPSVVSVGIMTDADDTGGQADACYRGIRFQAEGSSRTSSRS